MLGTILGIAGSALGGLLGKQGAESANDQSRLTALYNAQKQEEFAKMGIRWRVEDAKAAGLHPLHALGASTPTFSPVSTAFVNPNEGLGSSMAQMGQNLSRAAAAGMNEMEQAQLELIKAQTREVNARAQNQENIGIGNVGAPGTYIYGAPSIPRPIGIPLDPPANGQDAANRQGNDKGLAAYVQPQPHKPTIAMLGDDSRTEGTQPFWMTAVVHGGPHPRQQVKIDLPQGTSVTEALESISENDKLGAAIIAHNTRKYGSGWLRAMALGYYPPPDVPALPRPRDATVYNPRPGSRGRSWSNFRESLRNYPE